MHPGGFSCRRCQLSAGHAVPHPANGGHRSSSYNLQTVHQRHTCSALQRRHLTAIPSLSSPISFTASRVQHIRSAFMDLHMLFAGRADFDSTGNSTNHTDSFQDMDAFTLIVEGDQTKPARGDDHSLISNPKSPLHEAPEIGNEDSSEGDVSPPHGVNATTRDTIKDPSLKSEPSTQTPRTYGILNLFSCQ
jgi:hypothetical protein